MVIYHVGAWGGNFGDSILQQSIFNVLNDLSDVELEFRYINCQRTEFTIELIEEINNTGNILIIGGGGLVFYRPQDRSLSGWQWNIDIELIDKINIPYVVYGIGYNQFEYDNSNFIDITNKHLIKTVEKAAMFSVRNQGSKEQLVARGCDPEKIEVIPDSGMFLGNNPIDVPGLNTSKVKIGFNWTTDREHQTFPEPFKENKEEFLRTCINVLNYLIKEKNAQIVHIGHMDERFDEYIINYLEDNLIEKPVIIDRALQHIYPPANENAGYLVDVYKQMDVVLGMRGHANIVSFGQHTPFIGIGSHKKIRYFLDEVNRSDCFVDVRPEGNLYTYESMLEKVIDCIDNKEIHQKQIKESFDIQKNIFIDFNKRLLKIAGNHFEKIT